jgi:hypothetical protein
MTLTKHIPPYVVIDGHRALTSYDGQPQTCYGCGDTDHMYHACPKRRVAKFKTHAPANPKWADISAATAPPASDLGVSDNNMITDPYPQPTRTVSPVPVDATQKGWKLPSPRDSQPASHEEFRIAKPTTSDQAHGAPTSLKWADEIPDFDMVQPVAARSSSGASVADKVWSPLQKKDMDQHSATDLRPQILPLIVGITNLQRALTTWLPPATRLSR